VPGVNCLLFCNCKNRNKTTWPPVTVARRVTWRAKSAAPTKFWTAGIEPLTKYCHDSGKPVIHSTHQAVDNWYFAEVCILEVFCRSLHIRAEYHGSLKRTVVTLPPRSNSMVHFVVRIPVGGGVCSRPDLADARP